MTEQGKINKFLEGKRFAVVGASANREKYGNKVLRVYQQNKLDVVPVNPAGGEIEGLTAYADLPASPARSTASRSSRRRRSPTASSRKPSHSASKTSGCNPAQRAPPRSNSPSSRRERHRRRTMHPGVAALSRRVTHNSSLTGFTGSKIKRSTGHVTRVDLCTP